LQIWLVHTVRLLKLYKGPN